jgi:uncharacterized protein HemY
MQQIRAWLAESPDDPELRYALAMEYRSAGDFAGAADEFRRLAAEQPDFVPTYLMLAQTLAQLQQADAARTVLQHGIAAARRMRNDHALGELQALLDSLEPAP